MPLFDSDWEIAAKVFESYPGGEDAFWLAWERGKLARETMDWFRQHATDIVVEDEVREADALLAAREARRRLLDAPEARRRERMILEALAFAVEAPGTVTLASRDPVKQSELRRRFAEALFGLLEHDLEIDPSAWSGGSEAAAGTAVLRVVFPELAPGDDEASPSFVEIAAELRDLRDRARRGDPADPTEHALRELAGPLLLPSPEGIGYYFEPSFRNYLRVRLSEACRRQGWRPKPIAEGGRFADLDAAFAVLTRRRVAEVFLEVGWSQLDPWLAVDLVANIP